MLWRCTDHRPAYFEAHRNVSSAIEREKELKGWRCEKRVALIESLNPTWEDFAADWFRAEELTRDPYAPVRLNLIRLGFGHSRPGRTRTWVSSAVVASRANSSSLTPHVVHCSILHSRAGFRDDSFLRSPHCEKQLSQMHPSRRTLAKRTLVKCTLGECSLRNAPCENAPAKCTCEMQLRFGTRPPLLHCRPELLLHCHPELRPKIIRESKLISGVRDLLFACVVENHEVTRCATITSSSTSLSVGRESSTCGMTARQNSLNCHNEAFPVPCSLHSCTLEL